MRRDLFLNALVSAMKQKQAWHDLDLVGHLRQRQPLFPVDNDWRQLAGAASQLCVGAVVRVR